MKEPRVCDNLLFAADERTMAKDMDLPDYQVEHVLEWQVVTKFFEWLSKGPLKKKFTDPNPKKTGTLDFCKYWLETWDGSYPSMFKLNGNGEARNAIEHLRFAYPARGNFEDEFVWLEKNINMKAKSQVSPINSSLKGPELR